MAEERISDLEGRANEIIQSKEQFLKSEQIKTEAQRLFIWKLNNILLNSL